MISSLSQGGGNLLDHHFLIVLKSARNKRNVLRDYLRNLAGKGEKALAKKLTPEQRPREGPEAVSLRWAKKANAQ
jgi:hypothetical protein